MWMASFPKAMDRSWGFQANFASGTLSSTLRVTFIS